MSTDCFQREFVVKQPLNDVELELTQRIQKLFPRGSISSELLRTWLLSPDKLFTDRLLGLLSTDPEDEGSLCSLFDTTLVSWARAPLDPKVAFAKNKTDGNRPAINFVSDCFEQWFFDKRETPLIGTTALYSYGLNRRATNQKVVSEFGGAAKTKSTLACLSVLLERQPNGEEGGVLSVGTARNIFCIGDVSGTPRIVIAQWLYGWNLMASALADLRSLYENDRMFSPILLTAKHRT